MNKTFLKQVLLFENDTPTYSKVKDLCQKAMAYQDENHFYFLQAKRGEKVLIKDREHFFRFVSDTVGAKVDSFRNIHDILNATNRSENIKFSKDSKTNIVKIFDNVVAIKKRGEVIRLYQDFELEGLDEEKRFIAIENGESFLHVEQYVDKFDEEYFVYIAGYGNTLTRSFLKTKEVIFFVDYDIEGMNIYESFECVSKALHIPKEIKSYFQRYGNVILYKKQRARLRENYSNDVIPIIELIKEYSAVVEQEIIYETH